MIEEAAKAAGKSVSTFVGQSMVDYIESERLQEGLIRLPTFREALTEALTRPDVLRAMLGFLEGTITHPGNAAALRAVVGDQLAALTKPPS